MNPNKVTEISYELIKKRKCHTDLKFNHMCVITTKKGVPLSYGHNDYDYKTETTEHAEEMAIRKLIEKINSSNNNKKNVCNLIVVRTNGHNSKPCSKCIELIKKYSHIITIKNIYYTHEDECCGMRKIKFKDLIEEPKHISSYQRFMDKRCNKQNQSCSC